MDSFKCLRCGHESNTKGNLKQHLKKKKICNNDILDITQEECLELMNDYNKTVELFINENKKFKEKLERFEQIEKNVFSTLLIQNENKKRIKVNSFYNTDYDLIQDDEFKQIVEKDDFDIKRLIEYLHFNTKYPENHNVMIENKETKEILIFDGEKFVVMNSGMDGLEEFLELKLKDIKNNEGMQTLGVYNKVRRAFSRRRL